MDLLFLDALLLRVPTGSPYSNQDYYDNSAEMSSYAPGSGEPDGNEGAKETVQVGREGADVRGEKEEEGEEDMVLECR